MSGSWIRSNTPAACPSIWSTSFGHFSRTSRHCPDYRGLRIKSSLKLPPLRLVGAVTTPRHYTSPKDRTPDLACILLSHAPAPSVSAAATSSLAILFVTNSLERGARFPHHHASPLPPTRMAAIKARACGTTENGPSLQPFRSARMSWDAVAPLRYP